MTRVAIIAFALILAAACSTGQSQALEPFNSDAHGFTVSHPSSWQRVDTDDGRRAWFVPTLPPQGESPESQATEFIVVMTRAEPGPLSESEVRRLAMSLLPMHGVSGFQRTPASTDAVAWYRFELTGSTGGTEWASLGMLITGPQRLHYLVCAGPLETWRDRQKLCDEVLRSFKPGDLTR
jgi:hypothetical protein